MEKIVNVTAQYAGEFYDFENMATYKEEKRKFSRKAQWLQIDSINNVPLSSGLKGAKIVDDYDDFNVSFRGGN